MKLVYPFDFCQSKMGNVLPQFLQSKSETARDDYKIHITTFHDKISHVNEEIQRKAGLGAPAPTSRKKYYLAPLLRKSLSQKMQDISSFSQLAEVRLFDQMFEEEKRKLIEKQQQEEAEFRANIEADEERRQQLVEYLSYLQSIEYDTSGIRSTIEQETVDLIIDITDDDSIYEILKTELLANPEQVFRRLMQIKLPNEQQREYDALLTRRSSLDFYTPIGQYYVSRSQKWWLSLAALSEAILFKVKGRSEPILDVNEERGFFLRQWLEEMQTAINALDEDPNADIWDCPDQQFLYIALLLHSNDLYTAMDFIPADEADRKLYAAIMKTKLNNPIYRDPSLEGWAATISFVSAYLDEQGSGEVPKTSNEGGDTSMQLSRQPPVFGITKGEEEEGTSLLATPSFEKERYGMFMLLDEEHLETHTQLNRGTMYEPLRVHDTKYDFLHFLALHLSMSPSTILAFGVFIVCFYKYLIPDYINARLVNWKTLTDFWRIGYDLRMYFVWTPKERILTEFPDLKRGLIECGLNRAPAFSSLASPGRPEGFYGFEEETQQQRREEMDM